jgi:hypothetical protein
MALTIPQIVRQFKADVAKAIAAETIVKICAYLRYVYRDRVLGPVTTVHVFLLQILHGNTACTALSRLAGIPFTAAAYCGARMRLPLALFKKLLEHVCDALFPEVHTTGRWRGHSTWRSSWQKAALCFRSFSPAIAQSLRFDPNVFGNRLETSILFVRGGMPPATL